jgi:hypothetical protein
MYNMSVVDVIKHYQRSIERCPENKERVSLRCYAFQRLDYMCCHFVNIRGNACL